MARRLAKQQLSRFAQLGQRLETRRFRQPRRNAGWRQERSRGRWSQGRIGLIGIVLVVGIGRLMGGDFRPILGTVLCGSGQSYASG